MKAYIVTGSSSGVGAATALALAREGCAVAINYSKSAAAAEEAAHACIKAGGDALAVRADVSNDTDCKALAAAALSKWGRLDGLVNNAGTTKFASMRDLDALNAEDFQRIYAVNVIAAYQMVRACLPALREARGAVVNVSSISSTQGIGSSMAYAASKGALNSLTIAMAKNLGPEIRVNAVLPGFIETNWLKTGLGAAYEKARDNYRANSVLGATLLPEDVADCIVALLNAAKITGQLQIIDGGRGLGAGPGL
jgi:3-oxoacyl-[acyl-carrier protein] reductase